MDTDAAASAAAGAASAAVLTLLRQQQQLQQQKQLQQQQKQHHLCSFDLGFILVHPGFILVSAYVVQKDSNRAKNCKRLKNREDSSDLDENLTEWIAEQKTFI